MSVIETLTSEVSRLPSNRQLEVLSFVEVLEQKQGQTRPHHDPQGLLADQPSNLDFEDFAKARQEGAVPNGTSRRCN